MRENVMTRHQTTSPYLGRIAVAVVLAVSAAAFAGPPVATVKIRSLAEAPQKNTPVTFGQVFTKGAVPRGMGPRCVVDGGRAQVDVKRHHDDGSVRFAIVSAILPELPAKGSKALSLISAPPRPGPAYPPVLLSDLLKTGFDATVTLTFPNGVTRSVSARKLLQHAYRLGSENRQGQSPAVYVREQLDRLGIGADLAAIPWGKTRSIPLPPSRLKEAAEN